MWDPYVCFLFFLSFTSIFFFALSYSLLHCRLFLFIARSFVPSRLDPDCRALFTTLWAFLYVVFSTRVEPQSILLASVMTLLMISQSANFLSSGTGLQTHIWLNPVGFIVMPCLVLSQLSLATVLHWRHCKFKLNPDFLVPIHHVHLQKWLKTPVNFEASNCQSFSMVKEGKKSSIGRNFFCTIRALE
jgi:hypothetical protein